MNTAFAILFATLVSLAVGAGILHIHNNHAINKELGR